MLKELPHGYTDSLGKKSCRNVTGKVETGTFLKFKFGEILFRTLRAEIFNRNLIEKNNSREKITFEFYSSTF